MSYYDDEEEGRPAGDQGRPRQGHRDELRADPTRSPRAGYQQHYTPADDGYGAPGAPYAPGPAASAGHGYDDEEAADYAQPTPVRGYRAPAGDPYYQPAAAEPAPDGAYGDGYDYAEPPPRRRGMLNIAIVAGGLAVFGGIIFYAYNQGMRAGTESVAPILRADNSPTKIKPENPGGLEVPHQDKLIYDRLNPGSAESGEVERLLPPPEAPLPRPQAAVPPAEEGEAMPMAEEGEARITSLPPAPALPPQQQPAYQPPPEVPQAQQQAVSPPAQATGRPQPLTPPAAAPAPVARPSATPPATQPAPVATAPTVAAKPAVTPAPAGASVRVQVAAVDAEAKAAAEWSRLQRKFPELAGLPMRTVRADLGAKGIFYRIQGGPIDEARAKQICAALSAQGAGCVLVR